MYGNNGKILKVDLSTGSIEEESYDERLSRLFLGGTPFGWIFLRALRRPLGV
ncbi:MAG: hypothetical protein P8175_15085 [Deltaproteobacteria bacterium]